MIKECDCPGVYKPHQHKWSASIHSWIAVAKTSLSLLTYTASLQAITAALPVLRAHAPAHMQVGASANGFKTSTTEWLGGGTTPGMVVPDGENCKCLSLLTCSCLTLNMVLLPRFSNMDCLLERVWVYVQETMMQMR